MHYVDDNSLLYHNLQQEYTEWYQDSVERSLLNTNKGSFEEFIESKDLGVVSIGFKIYKIVDNKKWLLTKLKYGI